MTGQEIVARDPRVEPSGGDIVSKTVRKNRVAREAVYVTVGGTVIYDMSNQDRYQLQCSLSAWRRWAKGGSVDRLAQRPVLHDEKIQTDSWLRGQVNALANRCKPARSSTPYDETLQLLLELGLEQALVDYRVEQKVREILARRVEEVT